MNRRIANLMQLMLMSVLVTCVVMCCCQVHSFVLVMGEAQDTVSADMSGSCCSNCADEEASDSENEDSSAPEKSCRICCVKGSGLKDVNPSLPAMTFVVLPAFGLPSIIAMPFQADDAVVSRLDETCLRVPQRTLVRLHCAMQV